MPNPKRKHTRSRRDSRRAQNWRLAPPAASSCATKDCGSLHVPHRVCPRCGFYKGELVVRRKEKKSAAGGQASGEAGAEPKA